MKALLHVQNGQYYGDYIVVSARVRMITYVQVGHTHISTNLH
jgi:hypothetical protein